MNILRLLALLPLAAATGHAAADGCRFSAERTLDLDAADLAAVVLDTGAGDLDIHGVPDLTRIEVRGRACASSQKLLDEIRLDGARVGVEAKIATRLPNTDGGWFFSESAWMDVTLRMPAGLRLALRDSSGDVEIEGLAGGMDIKDSSGDLDLRNVGGGVQVTDSSGDIDIAHVDGDVTIRSDSSGDIEISDVRGNALVQEDSSGDVDFVAITGTAEVARDSSGDIRFERIGGNAVVGADGSGDIRADTVRGDFTVERKSGGPESIRHSGVEGRVRVPASR